MAQRYRKKPYATFEHATRIYGPTPTERRYRVVATDADGNRVYYRYADPDDARAKARDLDALLANASSTLTAGTVAALAADYLGHIGFRSRRYQERQESLLRCWILPALGDTRLRDWTPAASEQVLAGARQHLSPATIQDLGSVMRSLVTHAQKTRMLPKDTDPMWNVSYTAKATHQAQAVGYIPRTSLPNDTQCEQLFAALADHGHPDWALAMRLTHRSGLRWGELIALRPVDITLSPMRHIRVTRAIEQSRAGRAVKTTKNSQARTTIFPASLTTELTRHIHHVVAERGDTGLLFPGPDGTFAERRQVHRYWHRAAKAAGWPLKPSSTTTSIWHPHDLRHVAACWMLFDLKLDPAHVANMLGHTNPAFTLSRYVGVRTGTDTTTNNLTENW